MGVQGRAQARLAFDGLGDARGAVYIDLPSLLAEPVFASDSTRAVVALCYLRVVVADVDSAFGAADFGEQASHS